MSCYLRHLKDILAEAGVEVTTGNKRQVDQAIHKVVGVEFKNCPAAGRAAKQMMADEKKRRDFVEKLKSALV